MQGRGLKYDLQEGLPVSGLPNIVVFGVGGGGGNAVEYMAQQEIEGVSFVVANTDAQVLHQLKVPHKIQLGESGLGAGGKPEKGREAAEKNIEQIREVLKDADLTFIAAGMGGGTGTGAAPVVAQVAKEMGSLTVAVVSLPFIYERRQKVAEAGLQALSEHVDSLIVIPNDKLSELFGDKAAIELGESFGRANQVLSNAVQGIAEVITRRGLINVDFEDVRTVMSKKGYAMMGMGMAEGENRAVDAVEAAINNPLLDHISVAGAKGILVNITSGKILQPDLDAIGRMIYDLADEEAEVIIGAAIDEEMGETMKVTVIATGLDQSAAKKIGLRRDVVFAGTQGHEAAAGPAAATQPAGGVTSGQSAVAPTAEPAPGMPQQPAAAGVGMAQDGGLAAGGTGSVEAARVSPSVGSHGAAAVSPGTLQQPAATYGGPQVGNPSGVMPSQVQPGVQPAQPLERAQTAAQPASQVDLRQVEEDRRAILDGTSGMDIESYSSGDYLDIPTFLRGQND